MIKLKITNRVLKLIKTNKRLKLKLINLGQNVWSSKPLIKLSLFTNSHCLGNTVNKLVGSPLPSLVDLINLFMRYNKIENLFGLSQIIFIKGLLIPSMHLASICNVVLFISTFSILILLHIQADQDQYTSKINNFQKLKNIPMSKYIEFTFTSSKISMAGFVGTVTIKFIVTYVYKDLYRAAGITRYEDARIFHSLGMKKTVKLTDSICVAEIELLQKLAARRDLTDSRILKTLIRYPQLINTTPGKYSTDIIMLECRQQIFTSVRYDQMMDLINSGMQEVSEEVRLYFVTCMLHYQIQLRNCCKLLLP